MLFRLKFSGLHETTGYEDIMELGNKTKLQLQ